MKNLILALALVGLASCKTTSFSRQPVGDNCLRVSVRISYTPSPYVSFDTTQTFYVCDTAITPAKILQKLEKL